MMIIIPTQHLFDAFLRMALSLFNGVQALGSTTFKTHFHPGDQITIDKFQNGKPPAENVFEPGNVENFTAQSLHADAFTQSSLHTEKPLHRAAFTQNNFCTQTPLQIEGFRF